MKRAALMRTEAVKRDVLRTLRLCPYDLGDEMQQYGLPEKANPFAPETPMHIEWLAGWRGSAFDRPARNFSSVATGK